MKICLLFVSAKVTEMNKLSWNDSNHSQVTTMISHSRSGSTGWLEPDMWPSDQNETVLSEIAWHINCDRKSIGKVIVLFL